VFTGRGCACDMTLDVNFFRPTYGPCLVCGCLTDVVYSFRSGGDTHVDVNDVSYSLEKVIPQRKAEDTWQVDSFEGSLAAPTRPPVEVRSFSNRTTMFCSDWCCLYRPSCFALTLVNQ